ncbi:hypothetical protein [Flavobacterium sp. Arc2]|uniref:hypothetical protein n=1 Tax=Flavobacterium sp. Arc2 TaxID=3046685 RepID=UPI00352D583C
MNPVIYTSKFKDVIQFAKSKDFFLGSGNPNAKILFVGKEAAINLLISSDQHTREIINNANDWENNCNYKVQFSDVDNWFNRDCVPIYNPLYPYQGQINTIESRNKKGDIVRGKEGTSKTWYNYQKIIDTIITSGSKSNYINYHENAFITELNQVTGSYSKDIPHKIRKESIDKRKELFQKTFFKEFPITIVAVGHYVRDFDLQELFRMKFHEEDSKKISHGLNKEYINVHYDDLEKPTKLLIHTNQLSMVSNELINRLGKICKDFLEIA